jgi:membrane fusion protein, multidrug efflux system
MLLDRSFAERTSPMSTSSPHADAVTAAPPHPAAAPPPAAPAAAPPSPARRLFLWGLGVVVLGLALWYGVPMLITAFNTVSTDDAYVNSHVTAVAARVPGQVVEVLVDDNYRVKKGDVLVRLDPEPYQVIVDLKTAAVVTAKANLDVAEAEVQAQITQARASRFKLEHAIEMVNFQVAQLHAILAAMDSDLAVRERSEKDYQRVKELVKTMAVSPQEVDLRLQEYLTAKAKVRQELENAFQIRAGLGLSTKLDNAKEWTAVPKELGETPAQLDQTFSSVRQAAAEVMSAIAPLGVKSSSFDLEPQQILDEFLKRDPDPKGDPAKRIDRIYNNIIKNAPPLIQARARLTQAERDLDEANLNLRYCTVVAEIGGVITRRNVNPGNNVQAGQSLMAIRSLEIWIDANFKETQLADLRIGQSVKIESDIYGSRHEFEGRITGFTMGTGQTLALLPPQNATGNFVKIVQRLPVKIELFNYKPDDPNTKPLFVGLSVTPYVYFRKPLVGDDPGKGKALQPDMPLPTAPALPVVTPNKK